MSERNPMHPRYLSLLLRESPDVSRTIIELRKSDPKLDAVMAELVVIKRLFRRFESRVTELESRIEEIESGTPRTEEG
jgi:hypothetical protein